MDERTAELRDIFVDVADEQTVTHEQAAERGFVSDRAAVNARLAAVVARMRDRYDFDTDRSTDDLVRVVRGFYEGESDAALATTLETTEAAIRTARFDLHLVRAAETGDSSRGTGDRDSPPDCSERTRRALAAEAAARRASQRYRSAFVERLGEAGYDVRLTDAATEDGLREATAGIETALDR